MPDQESYKITVGSFKQLGTVLPSTTVLGEFVVDDEDSDWENLEERHQNLIELSGATTSLEPKARILQITSRWRSPRALSAAASLGYLSAYVANAPAANVQIGSKLEARYRQSIPMKDDGLRSLLTGRYFAPFVDEPGISRALTIFADVGFGEPTSLEDHVNYLLTSSALPYAKELANRVKEIEEELEEDDEDVVRLSETSVGFLIGFLDQNPQLPRPLLAASRTGYLMARWPLPERGKVNIHFYPDGRVDFYSFTRNPVQIERQDLDSSSTTAEALELKLRSMGIFELMIRHGQIATA